MPVPRDIALIFLCLEAFVACIVPLLIVAGLAYGVYWLRGKVELGLQKAFEYAEIARGKAEEFSRMIAEPLIQVHVIAHKVSTVLQNLVPRRSL